MSENIDELLSGEALRAVSMVNTDDKGDMALAYCDRHEKDMRQAGHIFHTEGALYMPKDPFRIFMCEDCLAETSHRYGNGTQKEMTMIFQYHVTRLFDEWDAGEAPSEWFEYIGEGHVENGMVVFDE